LNIQHSPMFYQRSQVQTERDTTRLLSDYGWNHCLNVREILDQASDKIYKYHYQFKQGIQELFSHTKPEFSLKDSKSMLIVIPQFIHKVHWSILSTHHYLLSLIGNSTEAMHYHIRCLQSVLPLIIICTHNPFIFGWYQHWNSTWRDIFHDWSK